MFNRKKIEVSDNESLPSNNIKVDKLLNFTNLPKESSKNYELFNILSNDGDSISTSTNGEEYVSMSLVIDLVKEIVQQELVAAGVISKDG